MKASFTQGLRGMDKYDAKVVFEFNNCKVVNAELSHAEYIAPRLRQIDRMEAECQNHDPNEACFKGFETDDITLTALTPDGVPMCMFGAGNTLFPYLWLLGTDEVKRHQKAFIKGSKPISQHLLSPHGLGINYVHEQNDESIRWLKFCGATFTQKLTFNNHPFLEFIIIKNHV